MVTAYHQNANSSEDFERRSFEPNGESYGRESYESLSYKRLLQEIRICLIVEAPRKRIMIEDRNREELSESLRRPATKTENPSRLDS